MRARRRPTPLRDVPRRGRASVPPISAPLAIDTIRWGGRQKGPLPAPIELGHDRVVFRDYGEWRSADLTTCRVGGRHACRKEQSEDDRGDPRRASSFLQPFQALLGRHGGLPSQGDRSKAWAQPRVAGDAETDVASLRARAVANLLYRARMDDHPRIVPGWQGSQIAFAARGQALGTLFQIGVSSATIIAAGVPIDALARALLAEAYSVLYDVETAGSYDWASHGFQLITPPRSSEVPSVHYDIWQRIYTIDDLPALLQQ